MLKLLIFLLLSVAGSVDASSIHDSAPDWEALQISLWDSEQEILAPLDVILMSSTVQEGVLHVQVRKRWFHRQMWSAEELADVTSALEKGLQTGPLPLKIETYVLAEQPEFTGVITEIDREKKQILVVDPVEPEPGSERHRHRSEWVSFAEDAVMMRPDTRKPVGFDGLEVGMEVQGWSEGVWLTSSPEQVMVLELWVSDPGIESPG